MKKILTVIIFSLLLTTTASAATNVELINRFCRTNYPGKTVKIVNQVKVNYHTFTNRKGKRYVYVIKFRAKSAGTGGYTKSGAFVRFNKANPIGKWVYVYYIYNPYTNFEDDVVARVSNGKIVRFK